MDLIYSDCSLVVGATLSNSTKVHRDKQFLHVDSGFECPLNQNELVLSKMTSFIQGRVIGKFISIQNECFPTFF